MQSLTKVLKLENLYTIAWELSLAELMEYKR